jgi:hypothetical protein
MLEHPVILSEIGRQRHLDHLKAAEKRRLIGQLRSKRTSLLKRAFEAVITLLNRADREQAPQTPGPTTITWAKE